MNDSVVNEKTRSSKPRAYGLALLVLCVNCAAVSACRQSSDHEHSHADHEEAGQDPAKGPHGGRLLADGTLALEITIFERGVPPEFRVYAYEEGKPLDPHAIDLTINLHRFGGRIDPFRFEPRDDYLAGDATVEEPHSFDVEVVAANAGGSHRWRYASHEGRTEISPAAIASSGIAMETVGPATIRRTVTAHGRIVLNEDHLAHYAPRYPGLVREARKRLGDPVARGDVLAVIESNESLQSYEIRSSIAGTVVAKDAAPGEFASESRVIYTVTDLSTVWADLYVSYDDFRLLRAGQIATVETREGKIRAEGALLHLSAVGTETTQKLLARVEVPNPGGEWRPGLFVTGKIAVGEENVPVAVKATALQKFRDWDVVFLNDGATFQAVPLELGRRDAEWVEVLSGLEPGQRYAAEGSFIVKADVGKSGATHDH